MGRDFCDAPAIDDASLDESFQQSYEFSLTEAYLLEFCFDDRCLIKSFEEKLRPPEDRAPLPVTHRQKSDGLEDRSMPSTLRRAPLAMANHYFCDPARQNRIDAISDQQWLITTRRREFRHFLDRQTYRQTHHRNETDE